MTRICKKCGKEKPTDDFQLLFTGLFSVSCYACREQNRLYQQTFREKHPETARQRSIDSVKKWRLNNREKANEYSRKSYHKTKSKPIDQLYPYPTKKE